MEIPRTRASLARHLGYSDRDLRFIIYELNRNEKYHDILIKKKNGIYRNVNVSQPPLKDIQRKLSILLSSVYRPPKCAHGYIKGRSIVTCAREHLRKKFLVNIDLEDFFRSIHFGRIRNLLMSNKYNIIGEVAISIASLACYPIDNYLPIGSPLSPVISNMITQKMDNEISKFCKNNGMVYTRYSDDLSFSFNEQEIYENFFKNKEGEIFNIINENYFSVNWRKFKYMYGRRRKEVCGIIVGRELNIRKKLKSKIRAMLHNWKFRGLEDCQRNYEMKYYNKNRKYSDKYKFEKVLGGYMNFHRMVSEERNRLFYDNAIEFNKLAERDEIRKISINKKNKGTIITNLNLINKNNYKSIEEGGGYERKRDPRDASNRGRGFGKKIAKEVSAFMNAEGGVVAIGIKDTGDVEGVDKCVNEMFNGSIDDYIQSIDRSIREVLEGYEAGDYRHEIREWDGVILDFVVVARSKRLVMFKDTEKKVAFYKRAGKESVPMTYGEIESKMIASLSETEL